MSHQALLLRKGVTGESYWESRHRDPWYQIRVTQKVKTLSDIDVHYTWKKYEHGTVHQDMLRCCNVGGSNGTIYEGMYSMCRHEGCESEVSHENGNLPAYRFGRVTKVDRDTFRGDWMKMKIEFAFGLADLDAGTATAPSRTIKAKGSDLLYWAVPANLGEAKAMSMMGATPDTVEDAEGDGGGDAGDSESSSDEEKLPPRKRRPVPRDILDPSSRGATYAPARRTIQDSDSDSDDSNASSLSFDSDLFPRSDDERKKSTSAAATSSKSSGATSAWGSPTAQPTVSRSNTQSTSNSSFGWGQSTGVVTPDEPDPQGGWGRATRPIPPGGTGWGSVSPSAGSGWGQATMEGTDLNLESTQWGTAASTTTTNASASTAIKYRQVPMKYSKRISSEYAVSSQGKLQVLREDNDVHFFLRWCFGERIKIVEVAANLQVPTLEKTAVFGGTTYHLVASKYEKQESSRHSSVYAPSKFGGRDYIKAFYLKERSGVTAQKEFDAIANFSDLWQVPGKIAKRLELLVSTASFSTGSNKSPYMYLLPTSLVEEIDLPENASMGCGFIPCDLLADLLGGGKRADISFGVRVRLVIPSMGIYKGNLITRAGVDKIQLTKAMKKVGASVASKKAFKGAFIIINQIYPSSNCQMMEREINPFLTAPPTTAEKNLWGIPQMVNNLLLASGVPTDVLEEYKSQSKQYRGRNHANLVGMCDCSVGGLPSDTVFISGIGVGGTEGRDVYVTRVPCTEPSDARVVKVVSTKPTAMSIEDWDHLQSLAFGTIVFSSPKNDKSISLVESINNSDLDGDNFFCLWDSTILSHLKKNASVMIGNENLKVSAADDKEEEEDLLSDEEKRAIEFGLIGASVPLEIDGKTENGLVVCKTDDGDDYVVKFGEHEEIMSPEDVTANREIVVEIIDHRGKGRNAEVEVLWAGNKRSWQSFKTMKAEVPHLVAEYALNNDLIDTNGWCWCKDYIRDSEIVNVLSHRTVRGNVLQVKVLYDDSEALWKRAKDVDTDILASYVDEKKILLSRQEWKWLKVDVKRAKKSWFASAQEKIADVEHMVQHTRLIETLHRAFKKRKDLNSEESKSFGKAFKRAIDVGKHGGRVPLDPSLRPEIVGKKAAYVDKFLIDD